MNLARGAGRLEKGRDDMSDRRLFRKMAVLCFSAAVLHVDPAWAERPSLNLYGATGLIDMPSAESQPDGALTFSTTHFGPVSRTTLSFQITPRLSGSFRYVGIRDWNLNIGCRPACVGTDAFETYYDRSFDLRFRVLDEGRYLPAVTIGLQDLAGTGLFAGEFVVATKNVAPNLKVTAGLGWGRLGTEGSIGAPFGQRPAVNIGRGGDFNPNQWFRGPAAPFGGVEWAVNDNWTVKAEYSSDAYIEEVGRRATFDRQSPFNFGVEYQNGPGMRLGAYVMHGSEVGLAAHFLFNPKERSTRGLNDGAPDPVIVRPSRTADPEAFDRGWVAQSGAAEILIGNLNRRLQDDGIEVDGIAYDGATAQVRVTNRRYDSEAQMAGRVARAMANVLPASIEKFEIVPVYNGMPSSRFIVQRGDLEGLEFAPGATAGMLSRIIVADAVGSVPGTLTIAEDRYPRFRWSLAPFLKTSLFDPDQPLRADLALRLAGSVEAAPGLVFSGSLTKTLVGNISDSRRLSNSVLPRVRTDGILYDQQGDFGIETLTGAWYFRPGKNLYGRVTAGYLESMFAGVSSEILWKPVDSPLALGVEINHVKQRDYDRGFGLRDYSVTTGHLSAYYTFGEGYLAQVDVGRYLAGDVGATLTLTREFENGWRVGAFATKTDVSAADFGEGSFDKGINLTIPLTWGTGTPSTQSFPMVLRPIQRDGGARLSVNGRLYESVRGVHADGLEDQWGRFWR